MNSLKKLIFNIEKTINKNIINKNVIHVKSILKQYNGNDWMEYISPSNNYKKKLIYENELFELFVITWMPKSNSKIHDHSENGCLFKILNGELSEYFYNKNIELTNKQNYKKNIIGFIENNKGYHKITNETKNITVSLHLYSPPKYKMNIYETKK